MKTLENIPTKSNVTVYSKKEFHNVLGLDAAYISIEGTPECIKYYIKDTDNEHLLKSSDTVLNLDFDDVEEDNFEYDHHIFSTITLEQARKTLDFIISNLGKPFIIHCKAGKSRSQAVGRFIVECFPDEYEENKERPLLMTPNVEVLRRLKAVYYERFGFGILRPIASIKEDAGKLIYINNITGTLRGLARCKTGYKWIVDGKFIPVEFPYKILGEGDLSRDLTINNLENIIYLK